MLSDEQLEARNRERHEQYLKIVEYLKTTPTGEWITGRKISKATGISTEIIGAVANKRRLSIQSVVRGAGSKKGSHIRFYRLHPTLEERKVERAQDLRNEERAAALVRQYSTVG